MKRNITPSIEEKLYKNLHNFKNHPLEIIKKKIYSFFDESFIKFDNINPVVKIEDNFDKLLIPKDHPARSTSDTYYYDENNVLRTHTSAHQSELLTNGYTKFLVTGDVYRKDEIDSCHYPVFHQMEGVCLIDDDNSPEDELKTILNGLINHLFPNCQYRFKDDYFPFTSPSFEVEVLYNNKWLEILGCGIIQQQILNNCNINNKKGWAFGLGLERLAMILFNIPDIRYFWSNDERFIKQFESGGIIKFQPYSKYPATFRDISFWVNGNFNSNTFCEIIREAGGDLIENVSIIDEFTNSKTNKTSRCYRITYRSNDRSLTNDEINKIQEKIIEESILNFNIEIR